MVDRKIDPVTKERHKYSIEASDEALTRFFNATQYYQDGDRNANPYAEPIVSSSSHSGRQITSAHPFLLRVIALAAGVELIKSDGHRKISDIVTDDFVSDLAIKYAEIAKNHEAEWPAVKRIAEIVVAATANTLGVVLTKNVPRHKR